MKLKLNKGQQKTFKDEPAPFDPYVVQQQAKGNVYHVTPLRERLVSNAGYGVAAGVSGYFAIGAVVRVVANLVRSSRHAPLLHFWQFVKLYVSLTYRWLLPIVLLVAIGAFLYHGYISWLRDFKAHDTSVLNTHNDDAYIVPPLSLVTSTSTFSVFPDAGAHSKHIQPTALIAHMMIQNEHGTPRVTMPVRYEHDVKTDDGIVVHYHDEIKYDDQGRMQTVTKPMFDEAFGDDLFEKLRIAKQFRIKYKPSELAYNPGNKVYQKSNYRTVADLIKDDWYLPDVELQRPAGLYVVDTDDTNVLVVARTRGGKGVLFLNKMIEMLSRCDNKCNFLANDPKSELIDTYYAALVKRGYIVKSFNLMVPSKSSVYNPLGYAVDAIRHGDIESGLAFIDELGDVLYPLPRGEEPVWNQASSSLFATMVLSLISYYDEQEHAIRQQATQEGWSIAKLNRVLDELWGHVTLYNIYKMLMTLTSVQTTDINIIKVYDDEEIKLDANGEPMPQNYLEILLTALEHLPANSLRENAITKYGTVKSSAKAEKMMSSIYAITANALSFFGSSGPAGQITSGRPSQNFDIFGLGFPRRLSVRLNSTFMKRQSLQRKSFEWTCFNDDKLQQQLTGDDFTHKGVVDRYGWCEAIFKGIFPNRVTYLRLQLKTNDDLLIHTFYFKFIKHNLTSFDGRHQIEEPVTHQTIVSGGTLVPVHFTGSGDQRHLTPFGGETIKVQKYDLTTDDIKTPITSTQLVITQTDVAYEEKQKAIFFVTPPDKQSYTKIILLLINQMFNMNVDKAYGAKNNGKPLYATNYLLDEAANLRSGDTGIPNLTVKESIGLGQSQRFTLVLQSYSQMEELYSSSIRSTVEGNTRDVIFFNSPDVDILKHISEMTGKRHIVETTSASVQENLDTIGKHNARNYGRNKTLTTTQKEVSVITPNNLKLIAPNNAVVVGRENPIWDTNQTVLIPSYLLDTHLPHARTTSGIYENDYSAKTVPSISDNGDFDLLKNTPDFIAIVKDVVRQSKAVDTIRARYCRQSGLTDDELQRLDQNELARDLMDGIMAAADKQKADDERAREAQVALDNKLAEAAAAAVEGDIDAEELANERLQQQRVNTLDATVNAYHDAMKADVQSQLQPTFTASAIQNGNSILQVFAQDDANTRSDAVTHERQAMTDIDKRNDINLTRGLTRQQLSSYGDENVASVLEVLLERDDIRQRLLADSSLFTKQGQDITLAQTVTLETHTAVADKDVNGFKDNVSARDIPAGTTLAMFASDADTAAQVTQQAVTGGDDAKHWQVTSAFVDVLKAQRWHMWGSYLWDALKAQLEQ